MEHLNAALLQILPGRNLEENLRIGLEACRRWKEMGADIPNPLSGEITEENKADMQKKTDSHESAFFDDVTAEYPSDTGWPGTGSER